MLWRIMKNGHEIEFRLPPKECKHAPETPSNYLF